MKLDIKNDHMIYIEIGDFTYYIENSPCGENVGKWETKHPDISYKTAYWRK